MAPLLHAFGARYDLPISLSLYLYAAAGVVVLSFVMVVVFTGDPQGPAARYPRRRVPLLEALLANRPLRGLGGAIGIAGLLLIIATGLLGPQNLPGGNLAEYILWIYFWAGLVIASGLVGNLYAWVNPFRALWAVLGGGSREAPRRLPARLGVWPAAAAYFLFACLELTSGVSNRPWVIAAAALVYTGAMLAGMAVFGAGVWLEHCDAFTVLFGVVGRFAPLEVERAPEQPRGPAEIRAYLRPWGSGLLQPVRGGWDWILFLVLMLSTLAFDGLSATPLWQDQVTLATQGLWLPLGQAGFALFRTAGLLALSLLFLAVFTAFMRLVIYFGQSRADRLATTTAFALTLVPIALVYNAAHNYSYLIVQSQAILPLLADPFGRGWRLLPTAGFRPSFALASAAVVWYVQVILIVLGHVIAVYLAHRLAGERFRSARNAFLSQYPMLVLMVLYTMTSLWILAQPITRGG